MDNFITNDPSIICFGTKETSEANSNTCDANTFEKATDEITTSNSLETANNLETPNNPILSEQDVVGNIFKFDVNFPPTSLKRHRHTKFGNHTYDPSAGEKKEFLNSLGWDNSGLDKIIKSSYDKLNLITYFTAGEKETRAWTVLRDSTAPEASSVIHTDFKKGFIRAETISYEDFIKYEGAKGAKENGKVRQEGKDYLIKDGDIVHFLFNI